MVQLMDFILFGAEITENELEFLETVSVAFNIPLAEFYNISSFILKSVNDVPDKSRVMTIDSNNESEFGGVKHMFIENLRDSILLLHIESTNTYILKYSGKEDLFLNGQNIFPGQTYTFDHGSTIRGSALIQYIIMIFRAFLLKKRLKLEFQLMLLISIFVSRTVITEFRISIFMKNRVTW